MTDHIPPGTKPTGTSKPSYDPFELVCVWLESTLRCKTFTWDPDQHAAATECVELARERLKESAKTLQEHEAELEDPRVVGYERAAPETPAPRRHDRDCDCHDCHYSKKHPQVKPHHAACGCFECAPKKVSIETDDDAARLHEAATILATALACDDYQPQHTKWMTEAAAWLNRPRPALKANYCLCKGTLGWTRDAGGTPICADCRLPIRCSANGDER